MLDVNQPSAWSRTHVALAALLAVAAIVLAFGIRASAAEACGEFCGYSGANFSGGELVWPCIATIGNAEGFPVEERSAKNACGGSYEIGWYESGSVNWKACLRPGEQRAEPGRWNELLRVASC